MGGKLKSQVRSYILVELLTVCLMYVLLRGQRWAEFIHKNLGFSFLGSLFSRILSHSLEALFSPSSVPGCSGQKDGWLSFRVLAAHTWLICSRPLEPSCKNNTKHQPNKKQAGNSSHADHVFQILTSLQNVLPFVLITLQRSQGVSFYILSGRSFHLLWVYSSLLERHFSTP